MKPNDELPPECRDEIMGELETFSVEVLEAALDVLEARAAKPGQPKDRADV